MFFLLRRLSSVALLLTTSMQSASQDISWVQTNGPVTGSAELILSMADASILSVVDGDIYRSIDDGYSWTESALPRPPTPPSLPITKLAGTPNGVVLAATSIVRQSESNQGGVFRSLDHGETWTLFGFDSADTLVYQFAAASGENILAHTSRGLLHTTDGGTTWEILERPLPATTAVALATVDSGLLVIMLSDGHTLWSSDNGRSWEPAVLGTLPNITSRVVALQDRTLINWRRGGQTVEVSVDQGRTWYDRAPDLGEDARIMGLSVDRSENALYLGTNRGVFRSDDHGQLWTPLGLESRTSFGFLVSSSGVLLAATNDGMFRMIDGAWKRSSDGIRRSTVTSLTATPGGPVVAGGFLGDLSTTSNLGGLWHQIGFFEFVVAVASTEDGQLFVATGVDNPSVYSTFDSGQTWLASGLSNVNVLHVTVQGTLLAGRDGLYRSTDRGKTWHPVTFGTHLVLDIAETSDTLYAGTSDGVWTSTDDGVSWARTGFSGETVAEVAASGGVLFASNVCYFSFPPDPLACGIFRSKDNGRSWERVYTADTASELLTLPNGDLYVCLPRGIVRTLDGGQTWTSHTLGLPTVFPDSRVLTAMSIDDEGFLYVGAFGRSVFRTTRPVPTSRTTKGAELPETMGLVSNYPNPFTAETTIVFRIGIAGHIRLDVHDLLGRFVATATEGWFEAGEHKITWTPRDLPSGSYLLSLSSARQSYLMIVAL